VLLALLVLVLAGIVAVVIDTITMSEGALGAGSFGVLASHSVSDSVIGSATAAPWPAHDDGSGRPAAASGGRS
jgi:hypothetical protein